MGWLALEDLELMIGSAKCLELMDDDRDGVADSDVVAAVLGQAEDEIEAALGGMYELPTSGWPDGAISLGTRAARRIAYRRRPDAYTELEDKLAGELKDELEAIAAGDKRVAGLTLKSMGSVSTEHATGMTFLKTTDGTSGMDQF